MRENPHQRATGYSSNIRPVIQYVSQTDENPLQPTCAPPEHYKTSTGTTHRDPSLPTRAGWPLNDPTLRKSMPSGFVKDVPITVGPREQLSCSTHQTAPGSKLLADFAPETTTTASVFDAKPIYPQKTEPKRGKDNDLQTWREDMIKTRFSVYNKERSGISTITGHQNFVPNLQASSRHLASKSETVSKFLGTPGHRLDSMPNVIRPRGPFDKSGISGTNSFVFSTHARPTYLTDDPNPLENKAINPAGRAGELIKERLKKTDPASYLNQVQDPAATTRALHPQQPTTRDVDVHTKSVGMRILNKAASGPKTASGYLDNTRPTMAYENVVQPGFSGVSNYTTSHSDPKNVLYGRVDDVNSVKVHTKNGFVMGTGINHFGNNANKRNFVTLGPGLQYNGDEIKVCIDRCPAVLFTLILLWISLKTRRQASLAR